MVSSTKQVNEFSFQISKGDSVTDKKRILLVEDSAAVLGIINRILTAAGYTVKTAVNGQCAFREIAKCGPFDLLVSDIVMPGGIQGFDVAREIRRHDRRTPVIFLTGYSAELYAEQSRSIAGSIYLMKPVTRAKLLTLVASAITTSRS